MDEKNIIIRRYRPAFFEGFDEETVEVNSVAELLAVPFIKVFAENSKFREFAMSRRDETLMVMHIEDWYVVGFVTKGAELVRDELRSSEEAMKEIKDAETD